MREWFEDLKDRWSEFKNDPNNKGKLIAIFTAIAAVVAVLLCILVFNLKDMSRNAQAVEAGELIEGQSALTERNAAGGVIADIDWDTVIGYDKDGNPIYGTFNMVPTVGGYDMCGAPIYKDDMVVTGMAEDGLPIYGNYSAIEQARIRGKKNPNSDIDWDSIVAYDADGNPIFGSKGGDPNIIGYDMLGNPIYKGSVTVIGRTDSGLPIYNYSTIKTAKVAGKEAQKALKAKEGKTGVDGFAVELASMSTTGITADQIKALISKYMSDGVISDDEIAELASKTGLSVSQIKSLLSKYGVGKDGANGTDGLNGSAKANVSATAYNSSGNDGLDGYAAFIKALSDKTGLSEDQIRSILTKYLKDGKITGSEADELAKELGLSRNELQTIIDRYGVGENGANGSSGANGTSGTNGTNGSNGTNGTNGINGNAMTNLIKEIAKRTGLSEDEVRNILSKYMSDGKLTKEEITKLAQELGLPESTIRELIEQYGVGKAGTNGTNGANGSSGANGTSGTNGTNGSNGTSGSNGTNGINGGRGLSGTNGTNGSNGSNGSDGSSGSNGTSGTNGTNGTSGYNGINGRSGTNGTNGYSGYNGINGINGLRGLTGLTGADGKDGKDATATKYKVTFDSRGGSNVGDQLVLEKTSVVMPQNPTKEGYVFDGWYKGGSLYNFGSEVTGSFTLVAQWKLATYPVDYENLQGAINAPTLYSYTIETESYTLPEPELDGYVFQGWTGTGLSGVTKNVTISKGSTGERKYRANWTVCTPNISFNWNMPSDMASLHSTAVDGTQFDFPKTDTFTATFGYTYGDAWIATDNGYPWPEIESDEDVYGYYFKGWGMNVTDRDGNPSKLIIKEYSTVRVTEDTTLYAQWGKAPHASYNVRYWVQTKDACRNNQTAQNSTNYELYDSQSMSAMANMVANPMPDDITGFTKPSAQTKTVAGDSSTVFDYYYIRNKYTLTVNKTTGISSATGAGTYPYDDLVTINATCLTGYTFDFWSGPVENGISSASNQVRIPVGGATVTANARGIRYYIYYNNNGGSGSAATQTVVYGNPYSLQGAGSMSKTGHDLTGWSLASGTSNSKNYSLAQNMGATTLMTTNSGGTMTDGGSVTLYAVWTPKTYTISVTRDSTNIASVNISGGGRSSTSSITVPYNTSVTLTATPKSSTTTSSTTETKYGTYAPSSASSSGTSYSSDSAALSAGMSYKWTVSTPGETTNYSFSGWYQNSSRKSSSTSYTFNVTDNMSLEARGSNYKSSGGSKELGTKYTTLDVSYSGSEIQSVSPSGKSFVVMGSTQNVRATVRSSTSGSDTTSGWYYGKSEPYSSGSSVTSTGRTSTDHSDGKDGYIWRWKEKTSGAGAQSYLFDQWKKNGSYASGSESYSVTVNSPTTLVAYGKSGSGGSSSVTPVDKQKFETKADNYIDRPSSVDTTTGGRIFRKAVHDGEELRDLKITCSGVATWGTQTDSRRVGMTTKRGGDTFDNSTAISPTLYVLNSAGNPMEWTGLIGLCDIDKSSSSTEQMRILPSSVIEQLHKGSNITIDTVSSGWYRIKSTAGASNDNLTARYDTNAVYYRVKIPTSGLQLQYHKTNGNFEAGFVLDLYDGKTIVNGLTFAKSGSWISP